MEDGFAHGRIDGAQPDRVRDLRRAVDRGESGQNHVELLGVRVVARVRGDDDGNRLRGIGVDVEGQRAGGGHVVGARDRVERDDAPGEHARHRGVHHFPGGIDQVDGELHGVVDRCRADDRHVVDGDAGHGGGVEDGPHGVGVGTGARDPGIRMEVDVEGLGRLVDVVGQGLYREVGRRGPRGDANAIGRHPVVVRAGLGRDPRRAPMEAGGQAAGT